MFSKLKQSIKKAYEQDKKARELEEEGSSLRKTIAQIRAFFAFVAVVAPLIGYATVILVCVCAILLPIIFLSQVIGSVVDSVKEFGSSVGNLFTSGCYGTDEECLEREEAKQEIHDEIINVAMMAASKIVEREINKEDNEKLVEDFLKSK